MKTIKLKKCNYEHQGNVIWEGNSIIRMELAVYPYDDHPFEFFNVRKEDIEYIK